MIFQARHISLAISLHVVLFAVLLSGLQCSRKVVPTRVIEAVLYDPSRQQVAQQKKTEEQKRAEEARRRQEELEQQKRLQAEQQERTRVETERRKKEAEVQLRQAQEREKKVLQERQQREQQDKLRKEQKEKQEKLKKEQQEQREKAEQEKLADELKAQRQREIEQEELNRQMNAEAAERSQAQIDAHTRQWSDVVIRHLQKNWFRPSGVAEDFTCTVQMQLLPDGTVTSARIVESCGSPALDKSVEDAVARASPIPRPEDPAVFERDFTIHFTPQ